MNAGKKDGAEHDPNERRQPAPDDRDGGPHNRSGPCYGGKMVPPEHIPVCWHKVHAIFILVGWSSEIWVKAEDAIGDEPGVE